MGEWFRVLCKGGLCFDFRFFVFLGVGRGLDKVVDVGVGVG